MGIVVEGCCSALGAKPRIHHEDIVVRVHRTIDRSFDICEESKSRGRRMRGRWGKRRSE